MEIYFAAAAAAAKKIHFGLKLELHIEMLEGTDFPVYPVAHVDEAAKKFGPAIRDILLQTYPVYILIFILGFLYPGSFKLAWFEKDPANHSICPFIPEFDSDT